MHLPLPSLHKRNTIHILYRLLQLTGALAVCVYYGRILSAASRAGVYTDAKWVFATTVGALSGATALAYIVWSLLLEFRAVAILFAWDVVIVLLWIVVSGIFGKMYLGENPEMDQGIQNMKVAAGFDLANMLLWGGSATYCGWVVFVAGRGLLNEGRVKRQPGQGGGEEGMKMEETRRGRG
jgi:hypothetical protein